MMSKKLTCVDVAGELLEQAAVVFGPLWKEDETYRAGFDDVCRLVDDVISSVDASELHVFIDDEEMTINISITADRFEAIGYDAPLYKLFGVAIDFTCESRNGGKEVELSMTFPPIWVEA